MLDEIEVGPIDENDENNDQLLRVEDPVCEDGTKTENFDDDDSSLIEL